MLAGDKGVSSPRLVESVDYAAEHFRRSLLLRTVNALSVPSGRFARRTVLIAQGWPTKSRTRSLPRDSCQVLLMVQPVSGLTVAQTGPPSRVLP